MYARNEQLFINGYASYHTQDLTAQAQHFTNEVFKKNGDFYKSKPKKASGDGKYVWRMIAFYSGVDSHMPVGADFDLDDSWWERNQETRRLRREHTKTLDWIAQEIVNHFPKAAEKGTLRWGRALGMV